MRDDYLDLSSARIFSLDKVPLNPTGYVVHISFCDLCLGFTDEVFLELLPENICFFPRAFPM